MISGMDEKDISTNFKLVKIRCFSGATVDEMYLNLILLLRKKTVALVSHVNIKYSSNQTFQIYDKLLNLVHFINENNPNDHVVCCSPIDRLDDGKAALTIKRLNSLLSESSLLTLLIIAIFDMHGRHLNEHGVGKLGLNFFKVIRSILNSGSAKQKLRKVHSKISSIRRSSYKPRSDKPETIYVLSHNLNEETIK